MTDLHLGTALNPRIKPLVWIYGRDSTSRDVRGPLEPKQNLFPPAFPVRAWLPILAVGWTSPSLCPSVAARLQVDACADPGQDGGSHHTFELYRKHLVSSRPPSVSHNALCTVLDQRGEQTESKLNLVHLNSHNRRRKHVRGPLVAG